MIRYFFIATILFPIYIFGQSLDYQLLTAVYENNEKAVFELLRNGANPNATTSDSITPLMYAVQNGNLFLTKKLLQVGANPDINSVFVPAAIFNAVENQDTAIVYTLLEFGANPNIIYKLYSKTPLFYAIDENNYLITDLLLFYGANPNIKLEEVTPLLEAVDYQADTSIIRLLADYGADINKQNKYGYSPLLLACEQNNIDAAKKLLLLGANPKIENYKNDDALKLAIKNNSDTLSNILLKYYNDDLDEYHTLATIYDNNFVAKKIRQKTNKKYLTPLFSGVILDLPILITTNDFFTGFKIGISENRYKFDIKTGIFTRFSPAFVLIEQAPNYYLQLREKRTVVFAEIDKNFIFKRINKRYYGAFFRTSFYFSSGSYKGSNMQLQNIYTLSPAAGFYYQKKSFGSKIGFVYVPFHQQNPFYLSFDFYFIIR
jgi:ankyrin repeat protein